MGQAASPGLFAAADVGREERADGSVVLRSRQPLGPYPASARRVPGGSLIALAAWTFRHRPLVTAQLSRLLLVVAAFGAAMILPGNI